jgi:hypothetical protein
VPDGGSRPARCLDCSEWLDVPGPASWVVRCSCGIRYSAAVLRDRDEATWERVRAGRLFDRTGDVIIIRDVG